MANIHTDIPTLFTDIASAIREKTGETSQIVADIFPAQIRAISGGGVPYISKSTKVQHINEYKGSGTVSETHTVGNKDGWLYVTFASASTTTNVTGLITVGTAMVYSAGTIGAGSCLLPVAAGSELTILVTASGTNITVTVYEFADE